MRLIFLVQASEAERARRMEQKLLALNKNAGVLFVGVEVVQDPFEKNRSPFYKVFIGCDRERDTSLVEAIAKKFLADEVKETQLSVVAHRGFARS